MSRATLNIVRWDLRARPAVDDLALVLLISLVAALAALADAPLFTRLPLGLVTVLFLPGYSVTLALFPRGDELSRVERAALAAGVSLSIVTILVLVLDRTPWGLRPTPIVAMLTGWIFVAAAIAWLRRRHIAPAERGTMLGALPTWRRLRRRSGLALVVTVGVLLLIGIGVERHTQASSRMTEFYALGPEGLAADYPRAARSGEAVTIGVGIINREGMTVTYQVAIQGESGSLAPPRSIEIPDGMTWDGLMSFAMPSNTSDQEVKLVLLKSGWSGPYRQLRLWIDGVPAGAPPR